MKSTRHMRISTSRLNDLVRDAVNRHHPTFVQGRQLRIYYATQADINPPTFVFFVNDPELAHFGYQRYLENRLRDVFGFPGTTIRMQFRPRTKDEDLDERRREQRQVEASPVSPSVGKRPGARLILLKSSSLPASAEKEEAQQRSGEPDAAGGDHEGTG